MHVHIRDIIFKFLNFDLIVDRDLHLANRQSITALNISSLFWMEKLIKFVSIRM